ncbi:hypothetical protein [Streptomyces sp. WG5]|uniref:hypothetical protein n=1 Tax=Streptomyces sp. WG5 TaxID=3417648 RepID=UPI003CF45AE1
MYSIRDRHTGEEHYGESWDEIAKRVWGPKARVQVGEAVGGEGSGVRMGMIVEKESKAHGENAFSVIDTVVLYK